MKATSYPWLDPVFTVRHIIAAWLTVTLGTALFVAIAIALVLQGWHDEAAMVGAFLATIPILVSGHAGLYLYDRKLLRRRRTGAIVIAAASAKTDMAATVGKLFTIEKQLVTTVRDFPDHMKRINRMMSEIHVVKGKARRLGRHDILKEADELFRDVSATRQKVINLQQQLIEAKRQVSGAADAMRHGMRYPERYIEYIREATYILNQTSDSQEEEARLRRRINRALTAVNGT